LSRAGDRADVGEAEVSEVREDLGSDDVNCEEAEMDGEDSVAKVSLKVLSI